MKNPVKYLRKAYINALDVIGVPVYERIVSIDDLGIGQYIIVSSQQKDVTERSKGCFEWLLTVRVDIYAVLQLGTSDEEQVDDLEEQAVNIIEAGLNMTGFVIKSNDMLHSHDLPIDTKTNSIMRRALIYEHWVAEVEIPTPPAYPFIFNSIFSQQFA